MSATINFYIRSERPHADNSAQLYMLFTINRKHKVKISLKKSIPIRKDFAHLKTEEIARLEASVRNDMFCWDQEKQRATSQCPNYEKINKFLDAEKKRANDLILKYELMGRPLTSDVFKKQFNRHIGTQTFSEYFLEEFKDRRSNKWSEETLKSYKSIVTKIQQFSPNLTLNGVNHKFLVEYENHMLKPTKEGGCGNSERTVANNMKVLRTLILIAIKNGDFVKDNYPFSDYKVSETTRELTSRDYLEPEELAILERLYASYEAPLQPIHKLSSSDWLERAAKKQLTPGEFKTLGRFLFSCYTGLRFRDMKNLLRSNIHEKMVENTRRYYIEITQHKVTRPVMIPLIDKALALINLESEGKLFDFISNQKTNDHMESIEKKSGINKHLTFHVSRHSFATICFLYGIDERVGQKLLGHKNRKFTEIYTHLSSSKLFLEMDKFNAGINSLNNKKEPVPTDISKLIQGLPPEKLSKLSEFIRLIS